MTQGAQMAEAKTKQTDESVASFLNKIPDAQQRADSFALVKMMKEITGCEPKMWGSSIVGFDSYHYKYASGHEGDWPITGFSPRKQNLTVYIMPGFEQYGELLTKLGKHKTAKSCLYIKRLDDIYQPSLKKLIRDSVQQMRKIVRERKKKAVAR
jgi:Domain of unknown function (DU1801)